MSEITGYLTEDELWLESFHGYHPCPADQCRRQVKTAGTYCCGPCRVAWESTPRWDIDGQHSRFCDERAESRARYQREHSRG